MKKGNTQPAPLTPALWNRLRRRTPETRVAMFHVGRSGSRVLADLLGQHSHVSWDGEVVRKNPSLWHHRGAFDRFVRRRSDAAETGIYGIELKFFHARLLGVSMSELLSRLNALGFDRFVILKRRNLLRKVVSSVVYHTTRKAHIRAGREAELTRVAVDPARVRIDRAELSLLQHLRGYQEGFLQLHEELSGRETLQLTYEDDIANDPTDGYRRTCAFLGLPDEPAEVRYAPTNPFPLSEIITNWPDVAAVLRDSEFEWMLDS